VPHAAAFYPGYPLLVGVLGRVLAGSYLVAANVVSLVATAAGLAGVHRLAETTGADDGTARRVLVAAAVFPSAFFLLAPYSEAVFVAASVWALVAARQRRWALAAVAAAVAGVSRNVGVLLVFPLALEAIGAWRRTGGGWSAGGWSALRGPLVATAAAPAAGAVYLAFGLLRWGTPLAPLQVQSGWQRQLSAPWSSLADAVRFATDTPGAYATGYHSLDLLVALPVLAAVGWLLVRGPASLAVYSLAHVAVWLLYPFPSRPLMSTPRFALAVVPIFLAFAAWTRSRTAETVWVATSAALLGVHALLFVTWYYVF
jgi:hypothetical protein